MGIKNDPDTLSGAPAQDHVAITPSDTVSLTQAVRSIYVGGTGDISCLTVGGSTATYKAVPVGTILPIACTRINATGTTATNLVGMM